MFCLYSKEERWRYTYSSYSRLQYLVTFVIYRIVNWNLNDTISICVTWRQLGLKGFKNTLYFTDINSKNFVRFYLGNKEVKTLKSMSHEHEYSSVTVSPKTYYPSDGREIFTPRGRLFPLAFRSYERLYLMKQEKQFVVVGNTSSRKNVQYLEKLFLNTRKSLHVIGIQGVDRENIKYYGYLDIKNNDDLRCYTSVLMSSSFVITASKQEAFGISLLNAMAYGCFPVLTAVGGHREIIESTNHRILTLNRESDIEMLNDLKYTKESFEKSIKYSNQNTWYNLMNELHKSNFYIN